MALGGELSQRLDQHGEPLAKRLRLAQNVFLSPMLPVPRKEEVVISWLCNLISTSLKKVKQENDDVGQVWSALQKCLTSTHMNHLGGADVRPSVKGAVVEVLCKCLKAASLPANEKLVTLECTVTVLESSSMQRYLRAELDLYMDLLSSVLTGLLNFSEDNLELCVRAVASILPFSRQTVMKHEFVLAFLNHAMTPLILLLTAQGERINILSSEINRCIQQVVFPKTSTDFSHFFEEIFKQEIKSVDPISNLPVSKIKYPIPFKLMDLLFQSQRQLKADAYISMCCTVFRSYVSSYKTSPGPSVYRMFYTICYLVGFQVKNVRSNVPFKHLEEEIKPAMKNPTEVSLSVIKSMLILMSRWNVSLSPQMSGTSFSDWLQMLLENMFPLPDSLPVGKTFIETMTAFVQLNPLTVEGQVKNVLETVIARAISFVDCRSAYCTLLCSLLAVYMKLNRVHVLISAFLSALKVGFEKQQISGISALDTEALVPPDFLSELKSMATRMPSASAISALNVLLAQIQSSCLKPIQHLLEDGKSEVDLYLVAFMHTVCAMLCSLLCGVRMIEQSVVPTPRVAYAKIMGQLCSCLGTMGQTLLKLDNNVILMRLFLTLSHFWAAESLLVQQYCIVGREELLTAFGNKDETVVEMHATGSLSYIHPHLSSQQWEQLVIAVAESGDNISSDLLLRLQLQLLTAYLMFGNPKTGLARDLVECCFPSMIRRLSSSKCETVLNQDTVCDLKLLAPWLKGNELVTLASTLVESLLTSPVESAKRFTSLLQEERGLMCALAGVILGSLRRVCQASKRKHSGDGYLHSWTVSSKVLSKLDTKVLARAEMSYPAQKSDEELIAMNKVMAEYFQDAVQAEQAGAGMNTIEIGVTTDLYQHLNLLQLLPLPYLSPNSQAAFFISLLSVAVDFTHVSSSENSNIFSALYESLLLGMVEKRTLLGPKLDSYIDVGILVKTLAVLLDSRSICWRILDPVVNQALRIDRTLDQVLGQVLLLSKKEARKNPKKHDILLATVLMREITAHKLRTMKQRKAMLTNQEITEWPVTKLKSARRILVNSMKTLVKHRKADPEQLLHAFGLTLDYLIKYNKAITSLKPHVPNYCHLAVSKLGSENSVEREAAEAMLVTVLHHRKILDSCLPPDLVQDIWAGVVRSPHCSNYLTTLLYESASPTEMAAVMEDLQTKFEQAYGVVTVSDDHSTAEKVSDIVFLWRILLGCQNLPSKNMELCLEAVRHVFTKLHTLHKLSQEHVLEFLHAAVTTSKLGMDMQMADQLLLMLSDISLPESLEDFITCGKQYLSVLSSLLLHRPELALDCIPSFLQRVQCFLKKLASISEQRPELSQKQAVQLAGLAFSTEKLLNVFVKPEKKKSFKRVAAYLIADLIAVFEEVTLCAAVKVHYQNMVHTLFKIVDDYSIKFLLRTMSPASNEIFKTLFDNYKKYYRFTGRV